MRNDPTCSDMVNEKPDIQHEEKIYIECVWLKVTQGNDRISATKQNFIGRNIDS